MQSAITSYLSVDIYIVTLEIMLTKNYRRYDIFGPKMASEMISEHVIRKKISWGGGMPPIPSTCCMPMHMTQVGHTNSKQLAMALYLSESPHRNSVKNRN